MDDENVRIDLPAGVPGAGQPVRRLRAGQPGADPGGQGDPVWGGVGWGTMSRQTMIPGPSTALIDGDARRKEFYSSREREGWPNASTSDLDAATSGAMNRMIDHLVDRKAVLTKLFRVVDTDQSGGIDATELGNALNSLGLKLSRQELRAIMMRLDSDGNGSIDLQEFIEHFKAERARRFDGHIPELKAAKMQLVQKLRDHTASMVAQKDGLYITLTQIEALQRTGDLSTMEVAALRRKIGDMVKRGMVLDSSEARDLRRTAQRCASLPAPAIHPRVRRDGRYELPGPRMGPPRRTTRRLNSAERRERDLQRREEEEISRTQKKHTAVAGRRKRAPTFNDEVAARNRSIEEMRARSTPPVMQQPFAPMEHISGSAAQVGLTVTEPTRRQRGASWVERDGKYVWQRVGASGTKRMTGAQAEQGLQRDLVGKQVEAMWLRQGTDMTRSGADMVRILACRPIVCLPVRIIFSTTKQTILLRACVATFAGGHAPAVGLRRRLLTRVLPADRAR